MGCHNRDQSELFYAFNLDQHIAEDHLLRQIDQYLDFSELRAYLADFYSSTGRPSIDPELMIRMLIVGYCYGIRSERRLCEEVHLNLAYRWFCRLGLEDAVPDHSTFSKNRHGRFRDSELFRWVFEQVVQRCITTGLVKGEGFAVDASVIRADANGERRSRLQPEHMSKLESHKHKRAVREYLEALDEQPTDQPLPKSLSTTDPNARWSAAHNRMASFAYSTNYLIDTEHAIILDVEATPSYRPAEVESTKIMIDRVESNYSITPQRFMGDMAYGSAPMLGWLVDAKDIEPHVPVWDKSKRKDDSFSASDFEWRPDENEYRCPNGKSLRHQRRNFAKPRTGITKDNTKLYKAAKADCDACPLKPKCCPNTPSRKIARSIYEDARNTARQICQSPQYQVSRCERKKVEMLFAHLKTILKVDRLRLRGLTGANDEFLLAATTQNLRRLAKLCAQGPPTHRIDASA